tara:strand:+ start:62 stop:382 length:321 start_codon:yes stop_codon:yes gene_type:complete
MNTVNRTKELLVSKLDFIIPTKFVYDLNWNEKGQFIPKMNSTSKSNLMMTNPKDVVRKVVELNLDWCLLVVKDGDLKVSDVLHDFEIIYRQVNKPLRLKWRYSDED